MRLSRIRSVGIDARPDLVVTGGGSVPCSGTSPVVSGGMACRLVSSSGASSPTPSWLYVVVSFMSTHCTSSEAWMFVSPLAFCLPTSVLVGASPVAACQLDSGKRFPADGRSVSNKSSNTTWNCGETCPVWRLRTNATFLECRGHDPR